MFILTNVMHSTQLQYNMISRPQLDLKGMFFHEGKGEVKIQRGD